MAEHYGSDATPVALQHRFRPVKKQADVLRMLVNSGKDTKDVDVLDKDGRCSFATTTATWTSSETSIFFIFPFSERCFSTFVCCSS